MQTSLERSSLFTTLLGDRKKSCLNITAMLVFSHRFHGSKFRVAFHWRKKEGKGGKKGEKKKMNPENKKNTMSFFIH